MRSHHFIVKPRNYPEIIQLQKTQTQNTKPNTDISLTVVFCLTLGHFGQRTIAFGSAVLALYFHVLTAGSQVAMRLIMVL